VNNHVGVPLLEKRTWTLKHTAIEVPVYLQFKSAGKRAHSLARRCLVAVPLCTC
jgi:hypothetical protein